ncbi:SLATT domain-containing protein [Streptomyces sp. TRM75563]|uniref:SLATT domain-containing protein n=1 Tax=Streptomyces sp. TRM75563 TaxID=2817418 RepID=UPI001F60037C|nr:SLATT domain-containing protein [Streptomyces sp. TRM75563]MCI4041959.1 SLATT domain-containing protein [Streptomyces sp. TRM75563]
MSQPEMQPEGPPRKESDAGSGENGAEHSDPRSAARAERRAGDRAGGRAGGRDLTGRPFPLGDWGEPAERLDELYRWVETGALDTADWYLNDRIRKRRAARALRMGTAAGVVAGAALPLLDLTGTLSGSAGWGYLSLLLGAACMGCDRYFGLTSGWIRNLATAQAVQRRLQVLQFDWASECVREMLGPTEGTASEAAERCLGVLRRFSEDITELVRSETADWMVEFRAGPAPMGMQALAAGSGGGRGEPGALPGRFSMPSVAARPNMPRQRPPESPPR